MKWLRKKKQNKLLLQWSSEHFFLNLLVQPYIKDSSFFLGTLKIPKVYSAKVYPCQLPKCVPAKCLKQKCIPATSPKLVNCKSLFPQKKLIFYNFTRYLWFLLYFNYDRRKETDFHCKSFQYSCLQVFLFNFIMNFSNKGKMIVFTFHCLYRPAKPGKARKYLLVLGKSRKNR